MSVETARPVLRRIDRKIVESRERQRQAERAGDMEVFASFERSIDRLLEERHALALRPDA